MDENSNWLNAIQKKIETETQFFSEEDVEKFRIEELIILIERISELENEFEEMNSYKNQIDELLLEISEINVSGDSYQRKFLTTLNKMLLEFDNQFVLRVRNSWHRDVVHKIIVIQQNIDPKIFNKNRLLYVARLAGRAVQYEQKCPICRGFKDKVDEILAGFKDFDLPSKEDLKKHKKTINTFTKHLKQKHKLLTKGYYISIASSVTSGMYPLLMTFMTKSNIYLITVLAISIIVVWIIFIRKEKNLKSSKRII